MRLETDDDPLSLLDLFVCRFAHVSEEFAEVFLSVRLQFPAAHFSGDSRLQQLRRWQVVVFYITINRIREVNLHSWHVYNYTPKLWAMPVSRKGGQYGCCDCAQYDGEGCSPVPGGWVAVRHLMVAGSIAEYSGIRFDERTDMSEPSTPYILAARKPTRQIRVGSVLVGGDAPISVQTMTTTPTHDVDATLQQIAEVAAAGCDIVRVACPRQEDADALKVIADKSPIPVVADIHFQPRYVFAAIEAGCAAVRVNPGNIKAFDDQIAAIARAASEHSTAIRIGINAGSLDAKVMAKHGKATPEALVESALNEVRLFEEVGFHDVAISVKHHDVLTTVGAYRLLSEQCDYPLHLGVTEAGPMLQGTVKSAAAFAILLAEGIGDTIRVSLSAPPVEEIKVGTKLLESLHLRPRTLEIISCPTCGRCQVDVFTLADQVTEGLKDLTVPLRVAVMGCIVNGPGEAREADLGVASGNGKGQIFVRGQVVETVPEAEIVPRLLAQANQVAAEMAAADEMNQ